MSNVTQSIENHQNLMQTTSGAIASIGLEKVGQRVAGVLVTPAVWTLNYAAQGKTPDTIDVGVYAVGLTGPIGALASLGTSLLKSIVDDDIDQKLRQIQAAEGPQFTPFIKACYRYGWSAPLINAQTIANKGGTAWQHENGLWVYITDINNKLVSDYQPKSARRIFQPKQPLTATSSGGFQWHIIN